MSKRVSIPTKPFCSWKPGDAQLISVRKAKSRKKIQTSLQNLNYRELAKTDELQPAMEIGATKSAKHAKTKPSKAKPAKDIKATKKAKKGGIKNKVQIKMKFNKK